MNTKSVLTALNQDVERFMQQFNGSSKQINKSFNLLTNLWKNYQSKINQNVLAEKSLLLGDYLASREFYMLAAYQCYGHFLQTCFVFSTIDIGGMNYDTFKATFFDKNNVKRDYTLRCLVGHASSSSYHLVSIDPHLKDISFIYLNFEMNKDTVNNVLSMLKLLQLSTQVALMDNENSWIVYNVTVHINTIAQSLMSNGFSTQVLEYLLWACVCMESSVPLMTVKYLKWRCQLYVNTCQCFYDIKAYGDAEEFAKRGLKKIEELEEIEKVSTSIQTPEILFRFKQATLKLNVMVFKRHIFESRRRSKGVLRPKMKPVLKDILHNQWPRTGVERMLANVFRGRAAQFLAIVEALTNSNRRLMLTSTGAPESDEYIYDVFLELFFAGAEIVSGGGGVKPPMPGKQEKQIKNFTTEISLIDLASAESQQISFQAIVRFVILAYCYESWDTFDALIVPVIEESKTFVKDDQLMSDMKILQLFHAVSTINQTRIKKKFVMLKTDELGEVATLSKNYKQSHVDDLLQVASILNGILEQKNLKYYLQKNYDVMVDVVLQLWSKCKNHFARINSSVFESYKSVYQDALFPKWLQILIITQRAMVNISMVTIDPCMLAEISLKLSFILVCLTNVPIPFTKESSQNYLRSDVGKTCDGGSKNLNETRKSLLEQCFIFVTSHLNIESNPLALLKHVQELIEKCLRQINNARDELRYLSTGIADDSLLNLFEEDNEKPVKTFSLNLKAFHLELMYQHHYVHMLVNKMEEKSLNIKQPKNKSNKQILKTSPKGFEHTNSLPTGRYGKDDLSKAIYLMCSIECRKDEANQQENTHAAQEAYNLLQRAAAYEVKLKKENCRVNNNNKTNFTSSKQSNIPPPPLLLHRGSSVLVFKPSPFFQPASGDVITSYSLFLRNSAGNNVKVRLSDTQFKGTGEQLPYHDKLVFTVRDLNHNERYMAAVAAYNKCGVLIGGSIGFSTTPILAVNPLPIIMAYGYLCRVAYRANVWVVAKKCFNILWQHLVTNRKIPETFIKTVGYDHKLNSKCLKIGNLKNSSSVLQRYFVESIFITVDISVKEGELFCDSICKGIIRNNQIARLNECERLLIAMEMSGWLNDSHLCIQTIVQIYGLIVPFIYWQYPVKPVLEVLSYVFAGLQETLSIFKNKRHNATTQALHHMLTCLAYYIAKILVNDGKKTCALSVLDVANKFLSQMSTTDVEIGGHLNFGAAMSDCGSNITAKKIGQKKNFKRSKQKGISKTTSDFSASGSGLESKALEIYIAKLSANEHDLELSGSEDSIVLNAVSSTLPPISAYKEVLKFKRKSHFLESFVGVLLKALNDRMYDTVLDWTKDTVIWLTKRNEIILNRTTNDTKGIVIVAVNPEDEKLKKFSAGLVEYGKPSSSPTVSKLGEAIDNKDASSTRNQSSPNSEKSMGSSKKNGKLNAKKYVLFTAEEKRRKDAVFKIQSYLPEIWQNIQRRRKLRNITTEELPWRCQMNLVTAECHFNISLDKFSLMCKRLGYSNLKFDDCMMDPNWFSLSTTGALIVSWAGCMKKEADLQQKVVDIGGNTIQHFDAEVNVVPTPSRLSVGVKLEMKNSALPKLTVTDTIVSKQEDAKKMFVQNLEQAYLLFKRAIVLAHRGCNWVLLQHSCTKLLSYTNTLLLRVCLLQNNLDDTKDSMPYTLLRLRKLIYRVFYVAADSLVDVIQEVINMKKQPGLNLTFGDIKENKGESVLVFDRFDENTILDMGSVKKLVMFAVELLYYEEKWEKLCSLIIKFNAFTNDYFSESLLPILVYGQRCLSERIQTTKNKHPEILFDQMSGVPIDVRMKVCTHLIEVGAHIDPVGYDFYQIPDDGLKYSIASTNYEDTLTKLREVTDTKLYTARLLKHSRYLLTSYLAGKQGVKKNEGKLARESSRVNFIASEVKPPSFDPMEYKTQNFDCSDDVENFPLTNVQLSFVVTSYERTIELLGKTKQNEFLAQAMCELGNVMYHVDNPRVAYKWWSSSLDIILRINDAELTWRKFVDKKNKTILSCKVFIERCGVWACFLGGVVATNIAKYIVSSNIDATQNMVDLAASFFKSMLCSSLIHPSAYHQYSNYDISLKHVINQVIPGLNLFSDPYRTHCGSLASSLLWICRFLVRRGFYVEVQPLLSLLHYLSCVVCKDLPCALEVKLLRIESLCELRNFEGAIYHFEHVISGSHLPKPADIIRAKLQTNSIQFHNDEPVMKSNNYQAILYLGNIKINQQPFLNVYGREWCHRFMVCQAKLLISIAEVIYDIPTLEDAEDITEKVDIQLEKNKHSKDSKEIVRITKSQSKLAQSHSRKFKDKQIDPLPLMIDVKNVSVEECKGKMLSLAEKIVTNILNSSFGDKTGVVNIEHIGLFVKCQLVLSRVEYARYHVMSAAEHMYRCLVEISSCCQGPEDTPRKASDFDIEASVKKYERADNGLDALTWLECRRKLSEYLHVEDNAVGRLSGPLLSLVGRVGNMEEFLGQFLVETKIFNDSVMVLFVEFMYLQLEFKCGKDTAKIIKKLQEMDDRISKLWISSHHVKRLHFEVKTLLADVRSLLNPHDLVTALNSYSEIEMLILDELVYEGYDCDLVTLMPVRPFTNVYLPMLNDFVSIKVRLHRIRALDNINAKNQKMRLRTWNELVYSIDTSINVIDEITPKDVSYKLELLFLKGEIQRLLLEANSITIGTCIETFIDVINLAKTSTADFTLIRQCYNEMAMAFNFIIKSKEKSFSQDTQDEQINTKRRRSNVLSTKTTLKPPMKQNSKEIQRISKAAWVCIRTAGVIAKALRKCQLVAGESNITNLPIGDNAWLTIPSFVLEDLSGVERAIEKKDATKKFHLKFSSSVCAEITWVHLLNYVNHLRRQCSYSTLVLGNFNKALVRQPLNCHKRRAKLTAITQFLTAHLTIYNKECSPILPIDFITSILTSLSVHRPSDIPSVSPMPKPIDFNEDAETGNGATTTDAPPDSPNKRNNTPEKLGDRSDLLNVRNPLQGGDFEIAIQWYKPELGFIDKDKVVMLSAMNNKPIAGNSSSQNFAQSTALFSAIFQREQCISLHNRLIELVQSAEADIALQSFPNRSAVAFTAVTAAQAVAKCSSVQSKKSKMSPLKSTNQKTEKDDDMKARMMPVIEELYKFFKTSDKMQGEQVPLFEVTWTNLLFLENLFNPGLGNITRVSELMYNWLFENFNRVSKK